MVDASLIHSEHTLLEPQIIPRFHVTQFAFANCGLFCYGLWESLLAWGALCWSWQKYGNIINQWSAKKTFICLIPQKGKPQWKAKNLQLLYDANICIILQRTYYRWNKFIFAIKEEWNEMKISSKTCGPWKLEPFYGNGLHTVQVLFCCRD